MTYKNQPDVEYYGFGELALFKEYTRDSWQKEKGTQAPPWDPSRPIKRWIGDDQTGVNEGWAAHHDGDVGYSYWDPVKQVFMDADMPEDQWETINLPGVYNFPKYEVDPTPAVVVGPAGSNKLNPTWLSTEEQARFMMAELKKVMGATIGLKEAKISDPVFRTEWQGETRRQWVLVVNGIEHTVGLLLVEKFRNGVGAPGQWRTLGNGGITWVTLTPNTGDRDPRPEVAVPVRDLYENEQLDRNSMTGTLRIHRTDMGGGMIGDVGEGVGQMFTVISNRLDAIYADIQKLVKR